MLLVLIPIDAARRRKPGAIEALTAPGAKHLTGVPAVILGVLTVHGRLIDVLKAFRCTNSLFASYFPVKK